MATAGRLGFVLVSICLLLFADSVSAQLKQNFYANVCPNVESIVRNVVRDKIKQTFVTIPATLRLFFHDCFVEVCIYVYLTLDITTTYIYDRDCLPISLSFLVHFQGCDASVIIASTPNNKAEKDHPDNLSLAGDGFDTVIKAKAAIDAVPTCRNKVSCADILAIATRDVVALVCIAWSYNYILFIVLL